MKITTQPRIPFTAIAFNMNDAMKNTTSKIL